MARRSSRNRLDQPRASTRSLKPVYDPEMFGRWSERVARFIGSARFIGWMTVFVVVWILWNTLASDGLRFDEFPFIFLTLMLSLQASYAAPLILLAQNRQADRDRVQYLEDRNLTERLVADTEYLTREIASVRIATGDLATRDFLRGEVRDLAEELTALLASESDAGGGVDSGARPGAAAGTPAGAGAGAASGAGAGAASGAGTGAASGAGAGAASGAGAGGTAGARGTAGRTAGRTAGAGAATGTAAGPATGAPEQPAGPGTADSDDEAPTQPETDQQ